VNIVYGGLSAMFDQIVREEKLMDSQELDELEAVIERGRQTFVEVGRALTDIRDRRGYRLSGFTSFEEYLQQRWGWTRQRGYQLIQAAEIASDLARDDGMYTRVDIPTEGHARALLTLAPSERRSNVEQLGDLRQYSTRELHQAVRTVKAAIGVRPIAARNEPRAAPMFSALDQDDRIEQGLAEHLPWADGEIDLGVTSPPYCLGAKVPYADGGDYDNYSVYRDELVPAWCHQLFRVTSPHGGRWCINVPIDIAGRSLDTPRHTPLNPKPVYSDWLQALLASGFTYRTTILWHDDQAGAGTDRGTPDPSAPHVVPPVETIIVVHRGPWKRILDEPRPHDLGHDDWLQLCGPRGLWRFPGAHDPSHPAPFPEELPKRLLQLFSWRQDVVADPFVGRGTTAAVAARLGRDVRALDRAQAYVTLTQSWVNRVRAAARRSSIPAE
jgi:site-specific DNA-methyltransferase (adenine-specific)